MAFRKAKSIELHEAHTTITVSEEGYNLTSPTGRHAEPGRAAFSIHMADLYTLADVFGVHPQEQPSRLLDMEENLEEPEEFELTIYRAYAEVPAGDPGTTILDLECDVLGPNLVDIRITSRQDATAPDEPNEVEAMTYSGPFTIWWAADRPIAPEQLIAQAEAHPPIPVETDLALGDGEEADTIPGVGV